MDDLQSVIRTIVDNPPPQMTYAWDEMNTNDQIVLSLLSEVSEGGVDSAVKGSDLRRAVKENGYPIDLNSEAMHIALESLFDSRVLGRTEDDGYYFRVDLFRQWIRRARSIWRLVGEAAPRKTQRRNALIAAVGALILFGGLGFWIARAVQDDKTSVQRSVPEPQQPGNIWIVTSPAGVSIHVDGEERGITPQPITDIEPGEYRIELSHPKYRTEIRKVTVEAGRTRSLDPHRPARPGARTSPWANTRGRPANRGER